MNESGIYWWPAMGKYRVRVTRNKVTYKLGYYDTQEEALKVKIEFLSQYELEKDDSNKVPMYSKEWFKRERQKQVASFESSYGKKAPNTPKLVITTTRWWDESNTKLKNKLHKENDGDIMFEPN